MRIVLATPLYPPEIAEPAPYVKELARRLSARHAVIVVAYARLPEQVPGVSVITVDKQKPLPVRLFAYFLALRKATKDADIVYAENGGSVELPAGLLSLLSERPVIMHIGDQTAHRRTRANVIRRYLEQFSFSRAKKVIDSAPAARPEILPFEPFPADKFTAYERSWDEHLRILEDAFNHAVA